MVSRLSMIATACLQVLLVFSLNGPAAVAADGEPVAAKKGQFFESKIRPLLLARCGSCHGARKQEGKLRVDQRERLIQGGESGRAIVPGKPGDSLLLKRVTSRGDQQMPPKTRLTDAEITALRRWVADGATWPTATGIGSRRDGGSDRVDEVLAPNAAELLKSLKLWLRADSLRVDDGAAVVVWPDSSGRGHDLTVTRGVREGGTGTAPVLVHKSRINGGPGVRFVHGNGLAASPDRSLGLTGDADFTVVLVGQFDYDKSQRYESVLMVGNPAHVGNPGKPLAILIELETGKKQLDLAGGHTHDASMGPGSAQVLYDQPNILVITRKKGPWTPGTRFWLNGESSQQVWGRDPVGTAVLPDIQMRPEHGVALGSPQQWSAGFRGDLAEVIVFDRVLSDRQRRGLEAELSVRHGVVMPRLFEASKREFTDAEKNYWAFRPVKTPPSPKPKNPGWAISGIDPFIQARLETAGLKPSSRADRVSLIRRVTFDLIGLPPTPEQIDAFLADKRSDAPALRAVVDRLLASARYGERWARHWLDVVRYAESTANDGNAVMRYAWRYRDYVIKSLNTDKPYNDFVIEQLAGDLLPGKTGQARVDAVVATGLLMLGPKALAETDKEQSRLDIVADQLDVTGRAFLGLTIGCARCHDHKFDSIPTVDYYSLASIFRSTEVFQDENRNATMFQEWNLEVAGLKPVMVMAPVEFRPVTLRVHRRGDRKNPGIFAPRRFLQVIAGEGHKPLRTSQSGRLELARWIASPENPLTARVLVNRVWQNHFGTGLVSTSDNFGNRGALPSHPELLDWLAADFVKNGWSIKSLHRRLVLSSTYMQASRGAIAASAAARKIDPDNRLLWTMPLERLDAEALRDAVLAVSGRLELTPGGSETGEFLYERGEVIDKKRPTFRPNRVRSDDPFYTESRRRSVFLPVVRNAMPDILSLFDAADPNGIVARRNDTTVPSQSLFLLNHPFVLENSRALAKRVLDASAVDDPARITLAYRLALGRAPRPAELERVSGFLAASVDGEKTGTPEEKRVVAWTGFAQTLFCRNEFLYLK